MNREDMMDLEAREATEARGSGQWAVAPGALVWWSWPRHRSAGRACR